ncbi:flagellar hook-associated protein FlgK [Lachnospiraceae bacterium HCP1S3_C3]|nr:flagellar hook-associated protein FlgK [Lachnospiraceae bacterium]MDD6858100.1 flagellar hook-associated protein FlgK [Lachnospiraceae bacterium]
MSGMTSIYVGVSGLQSSQTALNTTAHNLANAYTDGYTRQLSIKGDRTYINQGYTAIGTKQVGLGVSTIATSRVRSILLDKAYRTENSRTHFYDAQYDALNEISGILGELNGQSFDKTLENLQNAIMEMSKTPNSETSQAELVMYAEQFIGRANAIHQEMVEYQNNLNKKIIGMVDTVNSYGEQIADLNKQIAGVEASDVEKANDLRDQRDLILDKLSAYVNITYTEKENHYVNVNIEGVPFVTDTGVYKMKTEMLDGDKDSAFVTCVWPQIDGQEVFDFSKGIDISDTSNMGSLKGYLFARGDFSADYTDVPNVKDYDLTTPEGKQKYDDDVRIYNENVQSCALVKAEALFDNLVHGIITTINDIFAPNIKGMPDGVTSFTDADGNVYPDGELYNEDDIEYLDVTTSVGKDGKLPPEELFSRDNTERYIEVTGDDGNTYYILNKKNGMGYESLYKCGNVSVNSKIIDDYSKLPFTTQGEGDEDFAKATKLANKWSEEFSNLDPNNTTKLNFNSYYDQFVFDIGSDGQMYYNLAVNESDATSALDDKRQQVTGVSTDEELTYMIKYQQAYNASSRYVTVISEMLEHIINRLGA